MTYGLKSSRVYGVSRDLLDDEGVPYELQIERGVAMVQDPQPEGPMHVLVRKHKVWIREKFRDIAAKAGHKKPDVTAQQLLALLDGSSMEAFIQGDTETIRASKHAAFPLERAAISARDEIDHPPNWCPQPGTAAQGALR